jgi:protein O-GlcNAc transferase
MRLPGVFSRLFRRKESATTVTPVESAWSGTGSRDSAVPVSVAQLVQTGLAHHQAGRVDDARQAYLQVLETNASNFDALHLLGLLLYQTGQSEEGAEKVAQAISVNPTSAEAHYHLGVLLEQKGEIEQARACYEQALSLNKNLAAAHNRLGVLSRKEGSLDEAQAHYERALAIIPTFTEALSNLGMLLADEEKLEEAIDLLRKALATEPGLAATHFNLGNIFQRAGKLDDAGACYQEAIKIRPDFVEAHVNLGNTHRDRGELEAAQKCYEDALRLRPSYTEAHVALGTLLRDMHKSEEALASFRRALELKPGHAFAQYGMGHVLAEQDRHQEALACFRSAIAINPEFAAARWGYAMSQLPWIYDGNLPPDRYRSDFAVALGELDTWFDDKRSERGFDSVGSWQPFLLAYQERNNRDLLAQYGNLCARLAQRWQERSNIAPVKRKGGSRISVGIVSAHLRNHSVWNAIIKGWFHHMDTDRFELCGFHLESEVDEKTLFAESRAAHFYFGKRSLDEWVQLILAPTPDVLIYPEIGMDAMTVKLASLRLAPVQVATWGHPETTGLPTIDYYLSAADFEPDDAQLNYTEKLVLLPHLGCAYEPELLDATDPDLSALGISAELPILLCPGSSFKYAPEHDRLLTEIARELGPCQFIFFSSRRPEHAEKLRQRLSIAFARAGMPPAEYLVFIPWLTPPLFFGLMKHATLYLDTIGFSGFNTAMQAVGCGLPIVTREGEFMRGRFASGILKRIGLPDLVASSEAAYVEVAVRLARDDRFRSTVRERMALSRHLLYHDIEVIHATENFLAAAVLRG